MKKILTALLFAAALSANGLHNAKILETMSSGGYTYMKVSEDKKEFWIAMTQREVKVGESIEFTEQGWMQNFHSKTLNRDFDAILFAADKTTPAIERLQKSTKSVMDSQYKESGTITIAELFKNREQYAGKNVTIKAKVTKTSLGIMKLNWVHLQDGSNFEGMNDVVLTTTHKVPAQGDIVKATGKVVVDKDFGYGYFYPVIIQEAGFVK
ncbi:MAG: SH3-like domain-containing protein [Campylobacterales bacterium]|nr:SH3-like domain-containing protein [Campylobacterales bacterium]